MAATPTKKSSGLLAEMPSARVPHDRTEPPSARPKATAGLLRGADGGGLVVKGERAAALGAPGFASAVSRGSTESGTNRQRTATRRESRTGVVMSGADEQA